MPFSITWEERGVVGRFWGGGLVQGLLVANQELMSDHRFDDLRYKILNFLDVVECDVTESTIREIAAFDSAASLSNRRIKIAMVAQSEEILALINLYRELMTGSAWQVATFGSEAEAREWVSLPEYIV